MSIRKFLLAAGLALGLATPATAATPSFDCAKAGTDVEKLLCADDGLARQDRMLAALYRKATERAGKAEAADLRADQLRWLRARGRACPSAARQDAAAVACIAGVYEARIAELRDASLDDLKLYGGVNVQADRRAPLACLRFSAPLQAKQAAALESYVESAGGEALAARVAGDELCVQGLAHGGEYRLTVAEGLRGEGAVLRDAASVKVEIPDRPRRVAFPSRGLILPRMDASGLPIEAVNVASARVMLVRVDDADVIDGLQRGVIEQQISYADVGRLATRIGHTVWTGEVDTSGPRNQARRVAIPILDMLPALEPGAYLAVAEDPARDVHDGWWATSQWFVVSDIGLTGFVGKDGMTVAARALSTAAPAASVRLALKAANGETLVEAETDTQGLARIPAGYLRGEGPDAPRALYAFGDAGDFVYLDMTGAPLDLSDRGVDGRPAPGALDAYITSERGVYRPGETVHLTALLRDASAVAVRGMPLTLKVFRHDGFEAYRRTLGDKGAGGYATGIDLPPNAATGMWRATLHADPAGAAIGAVKFLVEDFVPPRIEASLEAAVSGERVNGVLQADYLYGAPAAGLPVAATVDLRPVTERDGYRFGLVQEETPQSIRVDNARFETDGDGALTFSLGLGGRLGTSYPMEAAVAAEVFDVGGRPVTARARASVGNLPLAIGVKPLFEDGAVAEGGTAAFNVAAFDNAGAPVAANLDYRIVREELEYIWFQAGDRWDYRVNYLDAETIDAGQLAVVPDAPAQIAQTFERWGAYRIEVTDPATGLGASMRFRAGWWGAATAAADAAPDKVKVTLPAGPFRPGDTVRALIEPPFDAEVLATVVDGDVRSTVAATIPAGGGAIDLALPADGAGGAYVLVNAFAPAEGARSLAPRRAIGAAWAAYDAGPKSLSVTLAAPEESLPRRVVDVRVDVGGAGGTAYVTLAAVDDGVLGLTNYASPDPAAHFLGKRDLGLDLRDVYGKFIDAAGAEIGRVRSGGDDAATPTAQLANLPKKSTRVVALFSGVVETDAEGIAVVPLNIPEFSGRLRLMAQAWTASKVGAAELTVLVRRPVVAAMAGPRFMRPGDEAAITVALNNVSGPAGAYTATFTTSGVLGAPAEATLTATLAPGETAKAAYDVSAIAPGEGVIRVRVSGPGDAGYVVEQPLSVRPAATIETVRIAQTVGPGEALRLPPDLLAGFYPETATTRVGLNPLPDLDLPSVIPSLARYPYGCVEQTTSTATPLLYAAGLASRLGVQAAAAPDDAIRRGVSRLIGMQVYSGGFGFWDSRYEASPWTTVYATDFLVEARLEGADVPKEPLERALRRLGEIADQGLRYEREAVAGAYALYVRAKAGVADPARVRRFADVAARRYKDQLTLAFAGAALAAIGDKERASSVFAAADRAAVPSGDDAYFASYGSPVRDQAALTALLAGSDAVAWPRVEAAGEALSRAVAERRWLSTQDQAWVVRAAAAMADAADAAGFAVEIDGARVAGDSWGAYRTASGGAPPPALRNLGGDPVTGVVTVSGAPIAPPPPAEQGFTLTRSYFDSAGNALDPSTVRQNDVVVVVLEGEQLAAGRARALVVDRIPAGFELENARLGGGDLGAYGWLGGLSVAEHVELRDDRYVAAFNASGGQRFRVAYLARAVTPGRFAHGGARVEDMYQPEQFGRTAPAEVLVQAR